MVSFDVQSLFTSLPVRDCIEIVKRKLIQTNLPVEYAELLELCLTSGYFVWNEEYYLQIDGVAMGPVSPVVADIYMEDFEERARLMAPVVPKMYKRNARYNRSYAHAPARTPPTYVQPPQRSMFRDAASIAGGVTVGTTVGHLAGEAITSMFSGRRREEVSQQLPRDYQLGSQPSGPCAYEISQFLNCAQGSENLSDCQSYKEALKSCKYRHGIP